ncbi:type II toxin-antitoxin system RelE/ParE family toxin [Pseudodesulfovibrio portus]|nr:type II toxin-antitoxin system RelE/ParE family toxin [Pseudodesulfovibrio portus]
MKDVEWLGDSLENLKTFPRQVCGPVGYALQAVQNGEKPLNAKPLKGKGVSGVFEIVQRHDTNTFRAVYIAKLKNAVYVLHCFQKKSKTGKQTQPKDMDLIKQRLKEARERDKEIEGEKQ